MTIDRGALRIAVISGDDAHHRYLVRLLADRGFDVALWLIEPAAAVRRRLWRRRRYLDWAAATYHCWRRRLFGLDAFRRAAFPGPAPGGAVARLEVDWVNGPGARSALADTTPRATVLIGCSILQPETLALCGDPVLNVHGGYLPDYRGNHCIFFALAAGDRERIGATLHHVDAGVDTGDVLEVVPVPLDPSCQSAEALYCRAEHAAFRRLCAYLDDLAAGVELPRLPQPPRGRTFKNRNRTPWTDICHFSSWRLRRGDRPPQPRPARRLSG